MMIGRSLVVSVAIALVFLTNPPHAQADDAARFFGTIVGDVLRDQVRQDRQRQQQQQMQQQRQQPTTQRRQRSAAPAPRQPDLSSQDWMAVQRALAAMGHYQGEIDGLIGPGSRRAIAAWQSSIGAPATGYLLAQQAGTLVSLAPAQPQPITAVPFAGEQGLAQVQQPLPTAEPAGPSFDCSNVFRPVEQAICGSTRLSRLDREIADVYALALSGMPRFGGANLTNSQRTWLQQRNRCGRAVDCLENVMSERLATLTQDLAARRAELAAVELTADATQADAALAEARGQDEIFILQNSPAFPRRWTDTDQVAKQADLLRSLALPVIEGTDMEQRFISRYPLTEEEVRAAFRAAGSEIEPRSHFDVHITVSGKNGHMSTETVTSAPFMMEYNEFERLRITEALRDSVKAAMRQDRRDSGPERLTLICGVTSAGYDFDRQIFPFDPATIERCFAGQQVVNKDLMGSGISARVPIRTNFRPDGLRLEPQQAERVLEAVGGRPQFALAIPAELSVSTSQDDAYGRFTVIYAATPTGPMEIRAANDLTTVLHRFSDDELHDITDTPELRRLADFERPWWIENPQEAEVLLSRAREVSLDSIGAEDLFSTETGLTFAFHTTSRDALVPGMNDLSNFFHLRTGYPAQELSLALGISTDQIIEVQSGTTRLGSGAMVILPQDLASYRLSAPLPLDGMQDEAEIQLWTHLEVKVTEERLVDFGEYGQRLIYAARPDQLVLHRRIRSQNQQDSTEIFRTGFDRGTAAETGQVALARNSDLLLYGAGLADEEPEDLFFQHLQARRFAGSDAFAQREAAAELLRNARARAPDDGRFWREMGVELGAYDFDREGWPVARLSGVGQGYGNDAEAAINIDLMWQEHSQDLFIPMPPEQAREIQENSSFPSYDAYVALEVVDLRTGLRQNFSENMTLNVRPVEVIVFDRGQRKTIFNLGDIRLRHSFDAPPQEIAAIAPLSVASGEFQRAEVQLPIAGVRLGDDFDATVARITEAIDADRQYTANTAMRQSWVQDEEVGDRIDDWASYHNAILLESSSRRDMIALYHEPPEFGRHITAISRTRNFEPGAGPSLSDLKTSLINTYPHIEPAQFEQINDTGHHMFWGDEPHKPGEPVDAELAACNRGAKARATGVMSRLLWQKHSQDIDGSTSRSKDSYSVWMDAEGEYIEAGFAPPTSLGAMFGGVPCPDFEVMVLAVEVGEDGRIRHLRQVAAHPARITEIEAQRRDMAVSAIEPADLDL